MCQHWLRQWLVAWRHQAITWTNVDFSLVRLPGIHLRTISQWVPKLLILYNEFDSYDPEITATSPRGQWVNGHCHVISRHDFELTLEGQQGAWHWNKDAPGCTARSSVVVILTGVGVTKTISSIPLFSKFFNIIKTQVSCWILRLYLAGVSTAELSNMNVI